MADSLRRLSSGFSEAEVLPLLSEFEARFEQELTPRLAENHAAGLQMDTITGGGFAALKQQLAQIQVETETLSKQGEGKKKEITDLIREREILNKGLVKSADKTRATEDMVKIHTNAKKNIQNECSGFKAHAVRQRRMIESSVSASERVRCA